MKSLLNFLLPPKRDSLRYWRMIADQLQGDRPKSLTRMRRDGEYITQEMFDRGYGTERSMAWKFFRNLRTKKLFALIVTLLVFTLPLKTNAAIAFNTAETGDASASSITLSHTSSSGSNRILFVGAVAYTSTDDLTSCKYNGTTMNVVGKSIHPSSGITYLFYLTGQSTGANNVVCTWSTSHGIQISAADYTGASQVAPPTLLDASTTLTVSGCSSGQTLTVTTIADNTWGVMVAGGTSNADRPQAGSGATQRTQGNAAKGIALFDSNGVWTPAGSHSMTYNFTGEPGGCDFTEAVLASFAPVAAAVAASSFGYYDVQWWQ